MGLCRELGITLEQGFEMTTTEIQLWAAYFTIEQEKIKESIKNDRRSN
jgi:hypothetical protein